MRKFNEFKTICPVCHALSTVRKEFCGRCDMKLVDVSDWTTSSTFNSLNDEFIFKVSKKE